MNRIKSLKVALTFFVLIIMISSAILSSIFFTFFYYSNIFIPLFSPIVLTLIPLVVSNIIGTILTIILSNRILKPLKDLIAATRKVSKGDFSVQVGYESDVWTDHSEIGELVRSFNKMTHELSGIELFRKDFINNFSHEFKTPIVSIRGFARQLQLDSLTEEQRREYTDIIIHESERLANLSTNILLLTKLENQEILADKTEFSLDEQLRKCILLLQKQWEEKEIDMQIELEPIQYYSNEEILSQVWLNLLSNAIKFNHIGGTVFVKCSTEGSDIKVKIADNGIGMDDETLHHIYEKFYQGDSSRKSEGNGLGLSLIKRIIDLCGGKISAKSQIGKGTTFIIRLPKHDI